MPGNTQPRWSFRPPQDFPSPRTDPGTVVPAGTLRPESLLDDPTTELVAGQAREKLTSRALRIKHVQYHMLSVLGDDRASSLGF